MTTHVDIAIIGAGPAGLCFAKSLAETGLKVMLIERQSEAAIADPAFDGREIAVTHHSAKLMQALGLWEHIDAQAISPLRDARVLNGASLCALNFSHSETKQTELGYLISNHHIRKAAYEAVKGCPAIKLHTDAQVTSIQAVDDSISVTLADGEMIQAKLLVGADSRFSETRRAMGIAADMHDFGKTMMVCVMEHTVPHEHTAWEWFDYGQTLALLPMNGMRSSVVVTLPPSEIARLMHAPTDVFNQDMATRFQHRLGAMQLVSTRHAYPLVTAYAKRMVGQRFALVGDAAVGMHPVTAHGFNFGLKGIETLSSEIKLAVAQGRDIGNNSLLMRFESAHRRNTRPLFMATHAIAKLYTSEILPARILRAGALRLGSRVKPFKHAVGAMLADAR